MYLQARASSWIQCKQFCSVLQLPPSSWYQHALQFSSNSQNLGWIFPLAVAIPWGAIKYCGVHIDMTRWPHSSAPQSSVKMGYEFISWDNQSQSRLNTLLGLPRTITRYAWPLLCLPNSFPAQKHAGQRSIPSPCRQMGFAHLMRMVCVKSHAHESHWYWTPGSFKAATYRT